ncbi:MAG: DUF6036 family nucleotidyltransferase [Actinomycetota bacterium]
MAELGRAARSPAAVYFTGGVTAILYAWRESTIDIDLKIVPDSDELLRALPRLKESLGLNVELAAPDQFIPKVPGWRDRSPFIAQEGLLSFFHYDLYSQALSKIERGHSQDQGDVRHMLESGLVHPDKLLELFRLIEPALYKYPAIDPASFRKRVLEAVGSDL